MSESKQNLPPAVAELRGVHFPFYFRMYGASMEAPISMTPNFRVIDEYGRPIKKADPVGSAVLKGQQMSRMKNDDGRDD